MTTTEKESIWYQGQFRIPELELDKYYVSTSFIQFKFLSAIDLFLDAFRKVSLRYFTLSLQITIEADIGEPMQRWMALDDIKVHLKVKIFRKGFALDNLWPLV